MKMPSVSFPLYSCIILLITALPLHAQQQDRPLTPLSTDNFECMQHVHCLTESEALKDKGWVFVFDNSVEKSIQELTASMNGENISLQATYNKDGALINATYKLQNFILPSTLLVHLTGPEFDGWRMAGNEMVVNNFMAEQTEYRVFMENGTKSKTLSFHPAEIKDLAPHAGQLTDIH